MDDNNNNDKNIITALTENVVIENNIFGYEIIREQIKLNSIPNEVLFYNIIEDNEVPLSNGDILNRNYKFKQNLSLEKTNQYYSLEYQYYVQDPDFQTLYNLSVGVMPNYDFETLDEYFGEDYVQYQYLSKPITVKFKLCHEYCETCNKFGTSNDNQLCLSCLDDYKYDYFNEFSSNCVPEGYFIDKEEENKLIQCTSLNAKYYTNKETNKTICFKISYPCPDSYPYLNNRTNECRDTETPSCLYINLINNECSFLSLENLEIYNYLKENTIQSYPYDGEVIIIEGEDEYVFELTTSTNEKDTLEGDLPNEYNLSMIDLRTCEDLLRGEYEIEAEKSLIILKYEKLTSTASQKNVQYEIFHPDTKEKLNLTICENTPVDLYIPISLSEKTKNLYEDLQQYGYDLFDANDEFYNDICTPYKSENGTDVLLSDRKKDFYNNNDTTCQANCEYSSYILETSYLKCECKVINEDIDMENPDKFHGEIILNSFYDVLKNSNMQVLKCFKLVFDFKSLSQNKGSIIVIIYFSLSLVCAFIYSINGIAPLKLQISKVLFEKTNVDTENQNQETICTEQNNKKIYKLKRSKTKKRHYAP